jgi:hypothetical protein
LMELAVAEATRQQAAKKRFMHPRTTTQPLCPLCRRSPRLRSDYLQHWFYGKLKAHATCSGTKKQPHRVTSLGVLPKQTEWRLLDRVTNPNTMKETTTPSRRRMKTSYEKRHGWVWCPTCGGLCVPYGKYNHHYIGSQMGTTYNIFRCFNRDCPDYRRRLKCRNGKTSWKLQHRGRIGDLPHNARRCPRCGGKTIGNGKHQALVNGVSRELVRVRCRGNCKNPKVFYFDAQLGSFLGQKKGFVPLKRGGPLLSDDNRPTCRKGDTMVVWRIDLRRYRRFRPRIPRSIRPRIDEYVGASTVIPDGPVLVKYQCGHKSVWKLPNGKVLLSQKRRGRKKFGVPLQG